MMKTVPAAAGYLCGRNGVQALIQPVTLLLIIAGTLAGLIPAWKASKVKPIEALRAE